MPTSTTLGAFRTRFPEFDAVEDDKVTLCLDDAELETDLATWGTKWAQAVTWLGAHFLASRYTRTGGPLPAGPRQRQTARTVDKVSTTFGEGESGAQSSILNTTRYGQQFVRLRRRCLGGPRVAR